MLYVFGSVISAWKNCRPITVSFFVSKTLTLFTVILVLFLVLPVWPTTFLLCVFFWLTKTDERATKRPTRKPPQTADYGRRDGHPHCSIVCPTTMTEASEIVRAAHRASVTRTPGILRARSGHGISPICGFPVYPHRYSIKPAVARQSAILSSSSSSALSFPVARSPMS